MSATIPSFKHTTKEDLQKEIEHIKYEKDQLQEKLYESGVEDRNTFMKQIMLREAQARESILYSIRACEKETGRNFPWEILF